MKMRADANATDVVRNPEVNSKAYTSYYVQTLSDT